MGKSESTSQRLMAGCSDCGVALLKDITSQSVWNQFNGVKDSFFVYDSDGNLAAGVDEDRPEALLQIAEHLREMIGAPLDPALSGSAGSSYPSQI